MDYRPYDSARDMHAVWRIYKEIGWIHDDPPEKLDWFFRNAGKAFVTEMDGEAECAVTAAPGDVMYQDQLLPFVCVTGVTTSRLGRRQKLAGRLTAAVVADAVADGAVVAGLGMFEQGFYNRLGFGTGTYEHYVSLPVPEMKVDVTSRVPKRLTLDDWEAIHAARLKRRRRHGSGSLTPAGFTRGRMQSWGSNHFGLGYADDPDGGLTHLIWCSASNVGNGPYDVKYLVYRTREQFLELMGLIKSLGDQVFSVSLHEPAEVQLQDLIPQPMRNHSTTSGSGHPIATRASAWWQKRICDLPACLARTHLRGDDLRFNLVLSDPIERYLPEDAPWRGVAGEYVVTLGPESSAKPGQDASLPTMRTTVNAFTRLWLGVRPATGLAMTDEIEAPESLLEALDDLVRLPVPRPDWDY
jgi:hypothetical protein